MPVELPGVGNLGLQAVTRDGSGNLWVSIVGVGVYQRLGERWVPFGGRDALPREPAVVLTTDEAGRTWLGYTGNRVAMVEGDSVRLFTADDGLSVGIVLAIHVRGSHVWVGGDRGLAVAGERPRALGHWHNRSPVPGDLGIVETAGGELWLHGASGITRIPADEARRAAGDSAYPVSYERLDFRDGLNGTAAQIRPQPHSSPGPTANSGSPPASASPGSIRPRCRAIRSHPRTRSAGLRRTPGPTSRAPTCVCRSGRRTSASTTPR